MAGRKEPKRTSAIIRLALWLILLLAVLTGVIAFVVYRDEIDSQMLSRLIPTIRLPGSAQGEEDADQLDYDPMEDNIFTLTSSGLCILNPRRLALKDNQGRELLGRNVSFARPTLTGGAGALLAYDRGGTSLLYLNEREVKLEKTFDRPILSAQINRRGFFAVVREESSFKAVAEVFDTKGDLKFRFQSTERYLTDAVLSPDSAKLAIAACGQMDSGFQSSLMIYDIGQKEPLNTVVFPDEVILGVFYPDNRHIIVLLETSIEFLDGDGRLIEHYQFGDRKLLGCSAGGDDFIALKLGRYGSGVRNELLILSLDGQGLMREEIREPILSMSSAGRYVSVLVTGQVSMYDGTGNLVGTVPAEDARSVLQYEDGSVLTLGLGQAKRLTMP